LWPEGGRAGSLFIDNGSSKGKKGGKREGYPAPADVFAAAWSAKQGEREKRSREKTFFRTLRNIDSTSLGFHEERGKRTEIRT